MPELLRFLVLALTIKLAETLDSNGLGRVPPMGWNAWNAIRCDVYDTVFLGMADRILELGLDKLGYRYVNLDDCWMAPQRSANGTLTADPERFPGGLKAVGDYLHDRGLLFGIYSSAGTKTCAGFPASLYYEQIDADTFASWGVDYLKYDNCFNKNLPSIDRYTAMRNALNNTGRPIFYSLCNWGAEDVWQWAPAVGNAWRSTGDLRPHWPAMVAAFWVSVVTRVFFFLRSLQNYCLYRLTSAFFVQTTALPGACREKSAGGVVRSGHAANWQRRFGWIGRNEISLWLVGSGQSSSPIGNQPNQCNGRIAVSYYQQEPHCCESRPRYQTGNMVGTVLDALLGDMLVVCPFTRRLLFPTRFHHTLYSSLFVFM